VAFCRFSAGRALCLRLASSLSKTVESFYHPCKLLFLWAVELEVLVPDIFYGNTRFFHRAETPDRPEACEVDRRFRYSQPRRIGIL
jgi:hypothetical protein